MDFLDGSGLWRTGGSYGAAPTVTHTAGPDPYVPLYRHRGRRVWPFVLFEALRWWGS